MSLKPPMWTSNVASHDDYMIFRRVLEPELVRRAGVEARLVPLDGPRRTIEAYCAVCDRRSQMVIDLQYAFTLESGQVVPNWRERLECVGCGLNNRMRAAIEMLHDVVKTSRMAEIYLTEQITPLYRAVKQRYPNTVGSEFLSDGTPPGCANANGIRFEDATRLTFPDAVFDCIISLDVLEHIPDYHQAIAEFSRCLKPGGKLLLSVPFTLENPETLIRATITETGDIQHFVEPEYHGDPLNGEGVLSFATFGWSLLRDLEEGGFKRSDLQFYWSLERGYLGGLQFMIVAIR